MKTMRIFLAVFVFAHALCATAVMAQPYPAKAVRVVVPYPPGGGNDIIGRLVVDELGKRMGRQMLVDNRPEGSTPEQLAERIRAELARYAKLIKLIGFKEG